MTVGKVDKQPDPAAAPKPQELVLGLPREAVPGGTEWRGVREVEMDDLLEAVARHGSFRARGEAETDPTWKQVIPYVLVTDGPRIFLMRRTRAGGDARLHDRFSIGVGGHVNPSDRGIAGGLAREWREEIEADLEPDFEPVGLLNDDSDPVGAVHLGLVYRVDVAGRPVAVRETHKLSGAFVGPEEVTAVRDRLETWSQLLFDALAARVR